jgi:hypothetical protein
MVNALGHYLNKPVLVSIPPVFGNAELHRCRLVGTETAGVWLESDDFTRITGMGVDPLPILIFVPFTQIVCLAAEPPREERDPPREATPQKGRQRAALQTRATRSRRNQ